MENAMNFDNCANVVFGNDTFNVKKMSEFLEGEFMPLKKQIMELFANPIFYRDYEQSKEQQRQHVLEMIKFLGQSGVVVLKDLKTNPIRYLNALYYMSWYDSSVSIKAGVQNLLWGNSILNLGTEKHHNMYLEEIQTVRLPGCFAMTEIEHGSNVRKLQTTSTYDKSKQEFVINTPTPGAKKFWIGNAAAHGLMSTVFARLLIDGKDYGIHAFVVPLRDRQTKELLPGVTIEDCGQKIGLNGVDNGIIGFNNVRIPRENLLNRFADVLPDGTYKTDIPSEGRRFGALLGELVGGRVNLVQNSVAVLKQAVTIAVRYAAVRKQFGPNADDEIPILDYRSHQTRLMPILAVCYAEDFARKFLIGKYGNLHLNSHPDENEVAEVHALSSGLKAVVTENTQRFLAVLRESCGGHGYAAYNRFGRMREDHDIYQTFEGDNTVLLQQVSQMLLKNFSRQFTQGNQVAGMIQFFGKSMSSMVTNLNPISTRLSSKSHLRNPAFQMQAFEYRTTKLLHQSIRELRKQRKAHKGDTFTAWNECLPLTLDLARAYIEQVILQQFIANVAECKDRELQNVLKTLCDLYALFIIQNNIGVFRNFELIKKNKAKAIKQLVNGLCGEVRVHSVSLVNAFGIPDHIMSAPIGLSNGSYVANTERYLSELKNRKNKEVKVTSATVVKKQKKRPEEEEDEANIEYVKLDV